MWDFDNVMKEPSGPSIYSEILEDWQRNALVAMQKLTDEEFNNRIAEMRYQDGYIIFPGMGPVLVSEMKRRDPDGTRRWG